MGKEFGIASIYPVGAILVPRRTHDDRHNGSRDAGRVNRGRRGDMPCMALFPHLSYPFVPEKGAAGLAARCQL